MTACGHEWRPVPGWSGRYRCRWCKGLGYKHVITGGMRGPVQRLDVYVCKHPSCSEPAVVGPKKGQRCKEHVKPENLPDDLRDVNA